MKPLFFGEADRLDDGGFVVGEDEGTHLQLGSRAVPVGMWLRYVRGVLHSSGFRFGVGSDQHTNIVWLVREDGEYMPVGKRAGAGIAIREVKAGVEVAYMPTPTQWQASTYSPSSLDLVEVRSGSCPLTSQGLIDFAPDGSVIVAEDPLDRPLYPSGPTVRWLVRRGETTFGKALGGLPDSILMARDGQAGTLHLGLCETYNISPNGRYWVGQQLAGERVVFGDVPAEVPALVREPEPTIRIPALTRTVQPIAVSAWFEDGAADFAEAGKGAARHPVTPHTMGVFVDVAKPGAPIAEAAALAQRIGWPLYRYTDTRPFKADVPAGDIPLLYGYGRASRSVNENLREIEDDIQAVRARYDRWALAISLHRGVVAGGFDRPEQFVLDVAAGAWRLAVKYRACHVRIFAYDRNGQDGCTRFPSFMQLYRAMQRASGGPAHYPGRETPDTPETPERDHPELAPETIPPAVSGFFPGTEPFMSEGALIAKGLRVVERWDDAAGNVYKFLASRPDNPLALVLVDAPGPETAVELVRVRGVKAAARLVGTNKQVGFSPKSRQWQLNEGHEIGEWQIFEDRQAKDGRKYLDSEYGVNVEVVL